MSPSLTHTQFRFLKQLASAGGSAALKDLKPATSVRDRSRLIRANLVEQQGRAKPFVFRLTEYGRQWMSGRAALPGLPTGPQRMVLLQLAFELSGAAFGPSATLDPADRSGLVKAGWVEEYETKPRQSVPCGLTDAGWKWVEEHLGDCTVGDPAEALLGDVLARLGAYLNAKGIRLADLIRASGPPAASPPGAKPSGGLVEEIRSACLRLNGGRRDWRIRLADLRRALDGRGREAIDATLLDLDLSGRLVLEAMDDPQEIRQDDRDAALKTPAGHARHLVYWTEA